MRKIWLLCLLTVFSVVGCGGGGGGDDIFVDDPFFDDGGFAPDLLAVDDNYSTFQNQSLSVGDSNGVISNDFICCDDVELRFPTETASGGTIVGRDDGSFVYTPPQNFTGTDFFDYVLEDDLGRSTGNVVIAVNEPPVVGFFVDSATGNDSTGSGSTGSPFATVQAAVQAAGANGRIVVKPGSNQPYTGQVNLLAGQILLGEGFEDIFPQGQVLPRLRGPIFMGTDSKITGLRIDAIGTEAINGVGVQGGEVVLCELSSSTDYALELNNATGTWFVDDNVFQDSVGGLQATLTGSQQLTLSLLGNTFDNNSDKGIQLSTAATSDLVAEIRNNVLTNHPSGIAVSIEANGTSGICLDLSDNENEDDYDLTRNAALFQVEELDQLETINTGFVTTNGDELQSVADGFCGF